jgi:DNA-binding LacI/PurR family transcriptional regulator
MTNGKGFSAETREKARAIAAELGWVPKGLARSLASRRTGVAGLLVHIRLRACTGLEFLAGPPDSPDYDPGRGS